MSKKILITGGSGLIGSAISELLSQNYSVIHLSQKSGAAKFPAFTWNVKKEQINIEALEDVDTIIHLAGANVGERRWTASWKKEIIDSRVNSTKLLVDSLKSVSHAVKTFISASAIGYYGFESSSVMDETSAPGKDFLARVTKQWEEEVDQIESLGIRTVKIRIGILLSRDGGALTKMVRPINYGVGAALGTGSQYMSWIHMHDLCGIFRKAVEDKKIIGAYNATANWATNIEMTRAIATILRKPLWLPNVPAFLLRIILGEMSDIVLNGSKVSSDKIKAMGFQFRFNYLDEALTDLLGRR